VDSANTSVEFIESGGFLDTVRNVTAETTLMEHRDMLLRINESSIRTRTRNELEEIIGIIKEILGRMERVDIDKAAMNALRSDLQKNIQTAELLLGRRLDEIRPVYAAQDAERLAKDAVSARGGLVIASTRSITECDIFSAENMARAAKSGIVNCFLYGNRDGINDEAAAKAFLKASGYDEAAGKVVLVNRSGLTYGNLVSAIQSAVKTQTGQDVRIENIGIRSAEGEITTEEGSASVTGALLEVERIRMNGQDMYAAINSYQALLNIMIQMKDRSAEEGFNIPGVFDTAIKGVFRYLPRSIPVDYDREIRAYRAALSLIRSAA
jgi:hypothetical protein